MALSKIVQVGKLLNYPEIASFIPLLSRPIVTDILRAEIDQYRQRLQGTDDFSLETLLSEIQVALKTRYKLHTQRVINATGIIVHTNLGRSPLSKTAWEEAGELVCQYSNLEFDIESGKRGNRMGALRELISANFGGEDNIIVNNNAASVNLILKAFAEGKEVIVSRGEQVQIGGGFRVPDILEASGAILRNVGTTNITTVEDYLEAINDNTAMVLVVHQSNYYIEGFTEQVDIKELAEKLPPHILLVVDQGSGNQNPSIKSEPTVNSYLKAGADIVCFSGDKVFGGPQAGIIIGKSELIKKMAKNPMMRVFRPGKETYALLERILVHRLNKDGLTESRIEAILSKPLSWHKSRAEKLVAIDPSKLILEPNAFLIGGGTTPKAQFKTWSVMLNSDQNPEDILKEMRNYPTPIMGVIQHNKVVLYPVTLFEDEYEEIQEFLSEWVQRH